MKNYLYLACFTAIFFFACSEGESIKEVEQSTDLRAISTDPVLYYVDVSGNLVLGGWGEITTPTGFIPEFTGAAVTFFVKTSDTTIVYGFDTEAEAITAGTQCTQQYDKGENGFFTCGYTGTTCKNIIENGSVKTIVCKN